MGQAVENRGPELLGVDALFLVLAVISTALRCFVRLRIVKAFGMDDWFMLGATISFVFYCACSITGIHYGTGHHHADLDPKDAQRAKHYWWFCYLAYCITMIASKTSIGLFLLRITIKRVHHWIIYISMFMSIITAVVFFFVTIFQCQPVEYFWNQMEGQQGTCIKVEIIIGLAFLYSSINVIMDFSFALLPWFLISGLQLDKKTKIALIPLLGMGCIASSAVVVRLGYLMNFKDPDFLWVTVDIAIWSTVEEGLAITAGSLATLRPLLKLLTIKLGLSKPSNLEPSGYLPGSRLPVSGDGSKVLSGIKGEAHKMSKLSQRDVEGYGGNVEIESYSYGRHLQAYPTNANQAVGRDKPLPKSRVSRSTNESQEELHNGSSIETPGQEYKGVVVTKTWFITDDRDAP